LHYIKFSEAKTKELAFRGKEPARPKSVVVLCPVIEQVNDRHCLDYQTGNNRSTNLEKFGAMK
jgi:hypothetical protein